ncbi:MAG: BatA domain-containing protein, partial [Candidatus Cloacimonetes bacterium]|nr:BatA domain-containing protein [Candidatus Cloacimonadota bacterium]
MFNLSFLNSILLFGLLAGIIPVLIHLFVKHQPKIVYFSSLRFLKQIQKNQARIIKLRQILLLITRILIIICLILALSRPVIKTLIPSTNWRTHAPTIAVMIIDNSFSMNYLDGSSTLLDRAKEIATEITEMLNDNDKVMLLTLNNNYNLQNSYFSIPSKIKDKINKISITDNSQLIRSILLKAEMELSRVDVINKEIYFITDNQKYSWENIQEVTQRLQTDIFIIPVPQEKDKINLTTVSTWFVPKLLSASNRSEIRADIKNFSEKKINTVIVSLIIDNITKEEKVISLNPFQSKQISFEFQDKGERFYFGSVKVKDEMLPDDNSFYFSFPSRSIGKLPKIVVISEYDIPFQFSTALDIITENKWERLTPEDINDDIITNNH